MVSRDSLGTAGTFAERILIVPSAHTHLHDISFQVEMYELFHRTPGGRIGHMLGTPTILLGALVLLSRAPGITGPLLAGALMVGIAGWGAAVDRLAGLMTAVAGTALALGGFALGSRLEARAPHIALPMILVGCAVQTLSHLFEDVPPPQSGTPDFVPILPWMRRLDLRALLRSLALTFGVFFWLELWASLRILPFQALHLLMRAGYRPELRRDIDARIAEIVAAPTSDWRRPRARGVLG